MCATFMIFFTVFRHSSSADWQTDLNLPPESLRSLLEGASRPWRSLCPVRVRLPSGPLLRLSAHLF